MNAEIPRSHLSKQGTSMTILVGFATKLQGADIKGKDKTWANGLSVKGIYEE